MYDFDYYDGPTFAKMVEDIYMDYEEKPDTFVRLLSDVEKPLFSGCKQYTKLTSLVCFYNLKKNHGWSDNSFSELLSLLKDTLPNENEMPPSMYEAKKTITTLGMGYEKIHACSNDGMLFKGDAYKSLQSCPIRGESRWKLIKNDINKEGDPAKVLWYFPSIPRFQMMFDTKQIAKQLTWHSNGRETNSFMLHPRIPQPVSL